MLCARNIACTEHAQAMVGTQTPIQYIYDFEISITNVVFWDYFGKDWRQFCDLHPPVNAKNPTPTPKF